MKAVTGIRDVHVVPADERTRVYSRDSLYLDVGATSEAEVRAMGISVGDPIVPDAPFEVLNGTGNYLGKAWDDRVGCAVVVEAMRRLASAPHPNQIVWAITTQEEIGLRGAHTAADAIKPELGIAIEGGITGDVYPGHPEETQAALGAARCCSSTIRRRCRIASSASSSSRPPPRRSCRCSSISSRATATTPPRFRRAPRGVPTVNLLVPARYTHAHNGVINRRDFDQMVELLVAMLQKLDAPTVAAVRDFTPTVATDERPLRCMLRHVLAIAVLPFTVTVVVPLWIARRFDVVAGRLRPPECWPFRPRVSYFSQSACCCLPRRCADLPPMAAARLRRGIRRGVSSFAVLIASSAIR